MLAITFILLPHFSHFSISIAKTRLSQVYVQILWDVLVNVTKKRQEFLMSVTMSFILLICDR